MIAVCTANSILSIADPVLREHVREYVHLDEVGLVIGNHYPVFAVAFRDGVPWYLICEEINDDYPTPHCSAFLDLVDARVREDWMLSLSDTNVGKGALLPPEWASDGRYLEKLVDGDDDAIALFRRLKTRYGARKGLL